MVDRLNSTPERINGKITLWGAFAQHRRDAKKRGIGFRLSFEAWLSVWEASGHLHERGARKGQYVMARFGDRGSYRIGNVEIILCEKNHSDANLGVPRSKSIEHRQHLSEAHKGKVLSEAHRKAIGDGLRGKLKGVPKTEAHRRALSEACKGRRISEAAKVKIRNAMQARRLSPEHRARISAANRRRWEAWRDRNG